MNHQYDNALLGILQNERKLDKFLDVVFGFLMRKTDFFYTLSSKEEKLGFPPGVNLQMVLKSFEKYKDLFDAYQRELASKSSDKPNNVAESSKNVGMENDTDLPNCENNLKATVPKNGNVKNDVGDVSTAYHAQPDSYNGAVRDNYTWSQTIREVDIKIKVPPYVHAACDLSVNIGRKFVHITVRHNGIDEVYFDRTLCWDVQWKESIWTFELAENQVHIFLEKYQERWWEAAFEGEEKINVREIDCSRPLHELDDEAQAKVQQLMYDDSQKRRGLPTSEQQKMQNILAGAWDKEGSPFKGIPYDATKIKVDGSNINIES